MEKELFEAILNFYNSCSGNYVTKEDAIYPELEGLKMYDAPLIGIASANDSLFTEEFKKDGIIHPNYKCPEEWLPGAKSVISFFMPFTDEVKQSNELEKDIPYEEGLNQLASAKWLHARVEGHLFINQIADFIKGYLEGMGYKAIVPAVSKDFGIVAPFTSNWSERHAAFAAGLGTFGLSKGLITKKGIGGRIGSVITTAEFVPTKREYTTPFEYCIMCGACEKRCPVGAIDKSKGVALGKDHTICGPFIDSGRLPAHGPNKRIRYACGKCQVKVPCAYGIPKK